MSNSQTPDVEKKLGDLEDHLGETEDYARALHGLLESLRLYVAPPETTGDVCDQIAGAATLARLIKQRVSHAYDDVGRFPIGLT